MLILIILSVCIVNMNDALPLNIGKLSHQSSPLNLIYPGMEKVQQFPLYQPLINPLQIYTVQPVQDLRNTYSPSLKQNIPGGIIGSIPFLPIHINVPDIVTAIIRALQSILGPNFPVFQQGTVQSQIPTNNVPNQDTIMPVGMMTKTGYGVHEVMPVPIIIIVPVKQPNNDDDNLGEDS